VTRGSTSPRSAAATLLLAGLLIIGSATAAIAADAEAGESPAPEASVAPTPIPAFDPSSVTIRTELIIDGATTPVYVVSDGTGNGCLYVVERGGTIRVFADEELRSKAFLDISDRVSEGAEQGLHSVAFHPEFKKNRRFFVHYNDQQGRSRIDEFRGPACRIANNKVVKTLLTVEQPRINNNAGWIGFGPDGYLYIPLGDGGGVSPGDPDGLGQAKATRLSKVLRIDVDRGKRYAIPKSNPFAKKRQGYPPETWAWGLRNPRRSSFDRATGDLWIGDVGQDRFEEIDRIPAGQKRMNFGWSDMEGDQCHNLLDCDPEAYDLPTHSYDSVSPHCGVVGGYVYRGTAIPELEGVYLFSDFCSGFIWGIDADAVGRGEIALAHQLLDAPQRFTSFGEGENGELFLVALDGSIYRIEAERGA
jgi:glucose/arabinose dehydrogenase